MRTLFSISSLLILLVAVGCTNPRVYLKDSSVKVTEVHFDPSTEQGQVEYIEFGNMGSESVDVSGWQVTGAGRLILPASTTIEPGKVIVVCQDLEAFAATFGTTVKPAAAFDGKLKNSGETIRVEDTQGRIADEASYDAEDPEVAKASDTGLSLHRVDTSGAVGASPWKASKPSPGSK